MAVRYLKLAKKYQVKVLMLTQTDKTHIKGSENLFRRNIKYFKKLGLYAYITPVLSNYEKFRSFGIKNVHYVPFVYPVQEHREFSDLKTVKIISVGKYTKRKDHLLLIKVVNRLSEKGYQIKLNIYGEKADTDYYNLLKEKVNSFKKGSIELHENIPYEEIKEAYRSHHLFVLPAYSEPAAYSPVEAMAYGLPVICSDQCGTKCYIEEAKNGYIFKARDPDDLSDKIESLLSNTELLKEMSLHAFEIIKTNHDPSDFAGKIKGIIFQK
jgi:glycosyltransferase involved in cell wall biosynthesis